MCALPHTAVPPRCAGFTGALFAEVLGGKPVLTQLAAGPQAVFFASLLVVVGSCVPAVKVRPHTTTTPGFAWSSTKLAHAIAAIPEWSTSELKDIVTQHIQSKTCGTFHTIWRCVKLAM